MTGEDLGRDLWSTLSRDITIFGGIQSPVFSWIGAAALLVLCLWHTTMLLGGVLKLRGTLSRVSSALVPMVRARQQVGKDWLIIPNLAKKRTNPTEMSETRRDLDDLQVLDRAFRDEPDLAKDWLSYRRTFAVEHSAWFLEPVVYSQRSAMEFFYFESFCAARINVRYYRLLPSFLTGMGLLLTFLAILIGLSKLHGNGSQIEGIQGLINGLSGKFVTSIVGLACANAFSILEGKIWHGLESQHRTCIGLLDELFPQKAADSDPQTSQSLHGPAASLVSPIRNSGAGQLAEVLQQRLSSTVAALTSATQALTALSSSQSPKQLDDLPTEIAHGVQRALKPLMKPLHEAIQELTRSIRNQSSSVQLSQPEMETIFKDLKHHTHETAGDKVRARWNR